MPALPPDGLIGQRFPGNNAAASAVDRLQLHLRDGRKRIIGRQHARHQKVLFLVPGRKRGPLAQEQLARIQVNGHGMVEAGETPVIIGGNAATAYPSRGGRHGRGVLGNRLWSLSAGRRASAREPYRT